MGVVSGELLSGLDILDIGLLRVILFLLSLLAVNYSYLSGYTVSGDRII